MNLLEKLKEQLQDLRDDAEDAFPDNASKREGYLEGLLDAIQALDYAMRQTHSGEDIVRVVRLYEFSGPRSAIEKQLNSSVQREKEWGNGCTIKAATLGTFPELLYPPKED